MEDGRIARRSIFLFQPEALRRVVLFAVAAVIGVAGALQLDGVLRTGFLLGLRFGGGRWFGGFAGLASVCAAD
jgi:hypothetical protein